MLARLGEAIYPHNFTAMTEFCRCSVGKRPHTCILWNLTVVHSDYELWLCTATTKKVELQSSDPKKARNVAVP